ncbi:MAG TPA: hypothetical protein VLM79_18445, partial [Kofleriaceae bacterium]|nr:hypothetical protein [Kofleriaceae bacterium]
MKGDLAARGDRDLAAAAQLLHRLCFDRVELEPSSARAELALPHEPRWSCQCKRCAAVWVASKSGSVLRIDLDTPTGRPRQTWTGGHSEARTIYHVHDGAALGGGPVLLVGRDNGALEIAGASSSSIFHLDSWWASADRHRERAVARSVEHGPHDGKPYTLGVTAIEVVSRADRPGTLDILVATRSLWLYVIEAAGGNLTLRHRVSMPGWIQWILCRDRPDDVHITCISRGGDIIELSHNALRAGDAFEPLPLTALSLLPTAAMPFDDGFLLGTTTGLFVVRGGRLVAVPVTRSPVLCLDRAAVSTGNDHHEDRDHDYIVLGLEDGNLRVVDAELIRALTTGDQRPEIHHHSFTVEMGSAVLAVETLQPSAPAAERAYVLAVLRDHSLRLFEVTHQRTVQDRVRELWQQRFAGSAADDGTARVAAELAAAGARDRDFDRHAWRYMVVDVVLPDLCERTTGDRAGQRRIVDLAMEMAAGADRLVLHRLSVGLARLARGDVGDMLELSRCVLAAVPHDDDLRWRTFIDRHLRELNALTRPLPDDERARFVAWTRFVRKYLLLGSTFAAKQIGLAELVEQNFAAEKYLDGLIYQARLSQRRYDLRWKTEVDGKVAALHVVENGFGPAVVVVVTFDGRLAFVEASSGHRIDVRSGGKLRKACAPFGDVTTVASAVARADDHLRVVLSCSGPSAPPLGLAVFDVRWSDVTFRELVSELFEVACEDPEARVSSVQPLPDRADGFVVGLQTPSAPVGLLWCKARSWRLDLATDPASDGADVDRGFKPEPRSLAPGKVPTRAIAVEIDPSTSRYLVATGSEDGFVRAISFAWGEPTAGWKIKHLDRVADAVSCIVLGTHAAPAEPDPDASQFSCYVGTATGDVFALSIFARDSAEAGPALTPTVYEAQPLWRDTHAGPILGVQLWQTPLFVPDRDPAEPGTAHAPETVLVVITEKGRLAVYKHSPVLDKRRTSALHNYFFRGMRFDRIAMPDRLLAFTLLGGARELVAAGPAPQRDGTHPPVSQLYMARLVYLRNSDHRIDPDRRAPDPRTPLSQLPRALPPEMWGRLHCLFVASVLDAPFELPDDQRYERKLDLWDLIRLEGGALSSYALAERLSFHEPWDQADIAARAQLLLHPLDPEDREDAERIKIILKSLCRGHLFADPNELTDALGRRPVGGAAQRHAQAAAAVQVVTEYMTDALAYASSAAARMRIVVIKELLRVPVLRHIASGAHRHAIRRNVERALGSCLRDDNRLVRIEALRAVSVMLRNVGVMADAAADRPRLIAALFPDGLGSLTWLLELIVAGLQLFPSFTRRTALVSGAWYHISTLLHVFRIFPDHTLALCDYLVREGLGTEPLAMCFRSLRGPRAMTIRHRIGHLYLIAAVEPMHARDEYIEHYDQNKPGHAALRDELGLRRRTPRAGLWLAKRTAPVTGPWHQIDDAAMAARLFELLHRLARMWDVRDRRQMDRELASFQPAPTRAAGDAPLGALERVVAALSSVAADLTQRDPNEVAALDRLAEIDRQHGPELTAPQRAIVSGVITAWRDAYNPPLPAGRGTRIREYTLGKPLPEGGLGSVFELTAPPDKAGKYVIKVLRQWNAPHAAARFLEGARFNRELGDSDDQKYIVEVVDIPRQDPEQRHLAYVMARYDDSLEGYLRKHLHKDGPRALRW